MPENNQPTRIEKLLLEAAHVFNSTLEYDELIRLVLGLVMKAVNAEAALVFRIDHNRTEMRIRLMKAGDSEMTVFSRELGESVVGWVAKYREPAIVADPAGDPRVEPELVRQAGIEIRSLVSVPLIGKGQMIGVVEAINKSDGDFTETDLDILTGLNNQIAVAIDNAHLYREVKREAFERHALYEIGKKLSSSLELDELLREILDSLRQVVSFDSGGVFLIDPETGDMKSIYAVGYDPTRQDSLQLKIGQGLIGNVATTGQPVIVPDVSSNDQYVEAEAATRSEIVVPIKVDDRMIGVLNLESRQLNAYDHRSLVLMEAFASQAAISLERARLHESILQARKLEEQLNIAREIQRSFLPKSDPVFPGYDICGTNISSGQVGGDYYDFVRIVDGHLGLVIGDVSGKGMAAALIMAAYRASLIAEIRNNYSIRTICTKVNSLMCESLEPGNFVTSVYGVLDFRNHILTFANCGHNPPVLLRQTGAIEYLREGGPVMGVAQLSTYEERAFLVNPGDTCVLYTDGVTEVFDGDGNEFGLERLVDVIRSNSAGSAADIKAAILEAVRRFASPEHVFDDLTLLIFKRLVV
ncbi:MAG TPA: SpoIIE family protein phosphatase [Acidobacteriota bacterium]|nr:SpoIIE family protein phosphatase [Acidobacteriota bacterium]